MDTEKKENTIKVKSSAKDLGIPVKETLLAPSEDGMVTVLVQETLPPFSIYTKEGLRVDVPGIPMDEIHMAGAKGEQLKKQIELAKIKGEPLPADADDDPMGKYIKEVFKKYIHQQPNCPKNIDFALDALKKFCYNYSWLDHDNLQMSAMVRSAMKDGIHFDFYEKTPNDKNEQSFGTKVVNLDNAYAQYAPNRRAIEFNCSSYPVDSTVQNTLAHELCHYAMDDTGNGAYLSTFVNSDFGKLWFNEVKKEVFFADNSWTNFKNKYKKEKKKEAYGSSAFFKNLLNEYKNTLNGRSYKTERAKIGEIFARVTGLLAKKVGGLDYLPSNHTLRMGVQLACEMAAAKASGNTAFYNSIVDTLKEHKISSETKEAVFNCMNVREEIKDKGAFEEEDFGNYVNASGSLLRCVKKEYEAIRENIDAKRGLDKSQIQAEDKEILNENKLHNLFGTNASNNTDEKRVSVKKITVERGTLKESVEKKYIGDVKRERFEKKYGNEKVYGKDHLKPLDYPPVPVNVEEQNTLKKNLKALEQVATDDVLKEKIKEKFANKK